MTARPFTPEMGRADRPRRDVPGWVHALALFAVLVASAWTGAHGGFPAIAALAGRVFVVAAVVWLATCLAALGLAALACIVLVLLDTAGSES